MVNFDPDRQDKPILGWSKIDEEQFNEDRTLLLRLMTKLGAKNIDQLEFKLDKLIKQVGDLKQKIKGFDNG